MALPDYQSVFGTRLGLTSGGYIRVDGKDFKGAVPTLGKDIFVDSVTGADTSDGLTPDRALATLNAAMAECTADKGYQIFVLPKHAETVTGVGGVTADVAGVSVFGLGIGAQRPRLLMDGAATVTYLVSAADHYIENVIFAAGNADVVRCFNITGAGFHAHNLEFVENTTAENFLIEFDATGASDNDCDGLTVTNCKSYGLDTAATEFIAVVADIFGLVVEGNNVQKLGTDCALVKVAAGKSLQNLSIMNNYLKHAMTANELLVNNDQSDNTGFIAWNFVRHADVTTTHDLGVDALGCGIHENRSSSVDNLSGIMLPIADVDL